MNANETIGIRELTAQELDEVNGGIIFEAFAIGLLAIGGCGSVGGMLGYLADWLFGD
jgi:lactobin A/cerein 7B family class IIb bacteriocin